MKYEVSKIKLQLIKENRTLFDEQLNGPKNAISFLKKIVELDKESEEVLILVTCDANLNVIGYFEVSRGAINETMISPREIFKRVILNNSYCFMLAHNHPSGDSFPSEEDCQAYKRIRDASEILGVAFIDNLIITDNESYSFSNGSIIEYGDNYND